MLNKNILFFKLFFVSILLSIEVTYAQGDIMETQVSATLESILILNIDPDVNVEFGIVEIADNMYQITKQPDDIHFSIESTGNWNLSISAKERFFVCSEDSSCKIPIDFVEYFIENKGTNWDNGLFSDIANRTKDTTLSLSAEKTTILVNGNKNNIGSADQNAFVLRWKLNFEDELSNAKDFSNFKIKEGYYKANFYLTLTETNSLSMPK
jgi:hypothetical protein